MSIEELAARQRGGVVPLSVRRADAQSATREGAVLAAVYDHIGIGSPKWAPTERSSG